MQPKELIINTPHLVFSALEWGAHGDVPVVALHGWLDNAASFIPMAPLLKGIRLIAVDLAGHGYSQHRPEWFSYDIWHYVEDLIYILESLNIEKFCLMGHSMGGVIATMAASSVLKKQVQALVTIDGLFPWPRQPEETPNILMNYINERKLPNKQKSVFSYRSRQQAIAARVMSQYRVSPESSALLVERSLREDQEGWVWTFDSRLKLGSPTRFTLEQTLSFPRAVTCPAHMIHADHGDIYDEIEKHRSQLTNFKFHPFSGTHHLHMDGPVDDIANIISSIFNK